MRRPGSTRSADRPRAAPPPPAELRIDRVGADGDGIGVLPDGAPAYLPLTLPGETVLARPVARRGEGWSASADALPAPSPDRVAAPCPLFGPCGGCTLQHWRDDAYAAWKAALLTAALARAGFADTPVAPLSRTPPGARRRMDLAIRRIGGTVLIGLHRRADRMVVDMATCLILHPTLFALLAPLRDTLRRVAALRAEGSLAVNLLDGPDLLLRTDGALGAADRTLLAAFAAAHGVPRISWARGGDQDGGQGGGPETAVLLRPPVARFGGIEVEPPSGTFLQASAEGEAAIVAAVLDGLPDRLTARSRIVELYAGAGTLTFALAGRARVTAFEGDAAAVAALRRAAGGRRVEVAQRDLARQPVMAKELADAAAVVLDPPYVGAAAQVAEIARSGVRRVVYVSCNPVALARDARVLRDAGYRAVAAVPVDQFLWSARLESVVAFAR